MRHGHKKSTIRPVAKKKNPQDLALKIAPVTLGTPPDMKENNSQHIETIEIVRYPEVVQEEIEKAITNKKTTKKAVTAEV